MTIRVPRPLERDADAITLIYELLDAHRDTAEIAEHLCDDPVWAAHLDYLRALQRTGRELLARMPADDGAQLEGTRGAEGGR